jgi:hypothetical protein
MAEVSTAGEVAIGRGVEPVSRSSASGSGQLQARMPTINGSKRAYRQRLLTAGSPFRRWWKPTCLIQTITMVGHSQTPVTIGTVQAN